MSWQQTPRRARITDIITLACRMSRISALMITGANRNRSVLLVRYAISAVARENGHSYPQIGKMLGGRDHSTIINGVKQSAIYIEHDPEFASFVDRLRSAAAETAPYFNAVPEHLIPVAAPIIKTVTQRKRNDFSTDSPDSGHAFHSSIARGSMALAAALRGAA